MYCPTCGRYLGEIQEKMSSIACPSCFMKYSKGTLLHVYGLNNEKRFFERDKDKKDCKKCGKPNAKGFAFFCIYCGKSMKSFF